MLLEVKDLVVNYGAIEALHGVSLGINEGELVAVIGHNGAGKSTLLNTISGVLSPSSGEVRWQGEVISNLSSDKILRKGISMVPEGRRVFNDSTVYDNIQIGAYIRKDVSEINKDIEKYMDRFPILRERRNQKAGLMSGGEQQMLAIVRALMCRPNLLLLDEPSLGLSPVIIKEVYDSIREIRSNGTTVLLVEQNAKKALSVSDRAYVLVNGKITIEGKSSDLAKDPAVQKAYLGG